jgi:hypothetical protein
MQEGQLKARKRRLPGSRLLSLNREDRGPWIAGDKGLLINPIIEKMAIENKRDGEAMIAHIVFFSSPAVT